MSQILWIPITKGGNLVLKLWIASLISLLVDCLHIPNLIYFDASKNYNQTLICMTIILVLDGLVPWFMLQMTIVNLYSSSKYSSTWTSFITCLVASTRILVLYVVNPIMDYVSVGVLYTVVIALQVAANVLLLPDVKYLDTIEPKEMIRQFDEGVEEVVRPREDN